MRIGIGLDLSANSLRSKTGGAGAGFYTDFSEYDTGVQPNDWSRRYSTSGGTFSVAEDAASEGGKVLRFSASGTSLLDKALTWNILDGIKNIELEAEFTFEERRGKSSLMSRGAGAEGSENLIRNQILDTSVRITTYNDGAYSSIQELSEGDLNRDYHLRRRVVLTINGDDYHYKHYVGGVFYGEMIGTTALMPNGDWNGIHHINIKDWDCHWFKATPL